MICSDDSLSADLARDGRLTEAMTGRFPVDRTLRGSTGGRRHPFHMLGFRPCIEASARARADAGGQAQCGDDRAGRRQGCKIGLLSTFAPIPGFDAAEFRAPSRSCQNWRQALSPAGSGGARGDDRLVAEASRELRGCDLIALAQYSMAPAAALVAEASGLPVLTHRIAPC